MNNNKNKLLKIQTLCLVTTFAFFTREVFASNESEIVNTDSTENIFSTNTNETKQTENSSTENDSKFGDDIGNRLEKPVINSINKVEGYFTSEGTDGKDIKEENKDTEYQSEQPDDTLPKSETETGSYNSTSMSETGQRTLGDDLEGNVDHSKDSTKENNPIPTTITNDSTIVEEELDSKLVEEVNITNKVSTPKEIISDVFSMISTPIVSVIDERLSLDNSNIIADSNDSLVASANSGTIIALNSKGNNNYEVWSRMHYNYSSNSNRSIHIFGLTLGGEYNFRNNKHYKIGLAYTLNSGNSNKYISNSISLYSSINDISIKGFKNNFANIIVTYGKLNTNGIKDGTMKHEFSTNLVSLNTVFGHNIVLANSNGIIMPTVGIRYDYINRNAYTNNDDISYGKFSANIITPAIGISYINKILNNNLIVNVGLNLGYGFNLNKETNIVVKTISNNHSETIGYINTNTLTSNFNLSLSYKVKKNIELSAGSNISYDINKTFNTGFSLGGKYQF